MKIAAAIKFSGWYACVQSRWAAGVDNVAVKLQRGQLSVAKGGLAGFTHRTPLAAC